MKHLNRETVQNRHTKSDRILLAIALSVAILGSIAYAGIITGW